MPPLLPGEPPPTRVLVRRKLRWRQSRQQPWHLRGILIEPRKVLPQIEFLRSDRWKIDRREQHSQHNQNDPARRRCRKPERNHHRAQIQRIPRIGIRPSASQLGVLAHISRRIRPQPHPRRDQQQTEQHRLTRRLRQPQKDTGKDKSQWHADAARNLLPPCSLTHTFTLSCPAHNNSSAGSTTSPVVIRINPSSVSRCREWSTRLELCRKTR